MPMVVRRCKTASNPILPQCIALIDRIESAVKKFNVSENVELIFRFFL